MNEKTIYERTMKTKNYSRIDNGIAKLPIIERGIMFGILSNSDDYVVHKQVELKESGIPENKFNAAWKNLIEKGYIIPERIQGGYKYTIVESPQNVPVPSVNNSTECTGTGCGGGVLITTNKKTSITSDNKQELLGPSLNKIIQKNIEYPAEQHPENTGPKTDVQLDRKIRKIEILKQEIIDIVYVRPYKKILEPLNGKKFSDALLDISFTDYEWMAINEKIILYVECLNELYEKIEEKAE